MNSVELLLEAAEYLDRREKGEYREILIGGKKSDDISMLLAKLLKLFAPSIKIFSLHWSPY